MRNSYSARRFGCDIRRFCVGGRSRRPDLRMMKDASELELWPRKCGRFRFGYISECDKKYRRIKSYDLSVVAQIKPPSPYLWVIIKDNIMVALEETPGAGRLALKKLKHTNLTGGKKAYYGGELWFISGGRVVVNGCSGRYGPRTEADMDKVIELFSKSGYKVVSPGWDSDLGYPGKYLR